MTSPTAQRYSKAKRKAAPSRRAIVPRDRLAAALAAQAASAEILRAIATSRSDPGAVFDAIARNAVRLCGAVFCNVLRYDGGLLHMAGQHGFNAAALKRFGELYPMRPGAKQVSGRVIERKAVVRIRDVLTDKDYDHPAAKAGGWRRALGVPMLRGGAILGVIAVAWREPGETPESQVKVLQTFADQAVIALDNARLFNEVETRNRELSESLERQTATSEILRAISRSPNDLQPVFDVMAQSAVRLCRAEVATVTRFDGELVHLAAVFGSSAAGVEALRHAFPMPPSGASGAARAIRDRAIVCIPDVLSDRRYRIQETALAAGFRAILSVPMLRDGRAIGAVTVGRTAPGDFSDTQVQLLSTFADQALIAVENVRLFNDTKEALEQQTAIGDILRATSTSPTDLSDVFEAVLSNALRLCEGDVAVLWRYDGSHLRLAAQKNASPGGAAYLAQHPLVLGTYNPTPRAGLERRVVHELDVFANPDYRPLVPRGEPNTQQSSTQIAVPLLRKHALLGVITIWRFEKRPFSDKQVALLGTFADQAVIAIENVRLLNETKESLERQTAISEVLRVISSSPTDVAPVMASVVESAARLANSDHALIGRAQDGLVQWLAAYGCAAPERGTPITRDLPSGRAMLDLQTTQIEDVAAVANDYPTVDRAYRELGIRTIIATPLTREGRAIGVLLLRRTRLQAFTDKEVALLKTFADQAAIAVENVRLFNETKEALERQTATGEILSSISSSVADAQPVFDAIVRNLLRLFNTKFVVVQLVREDGQIDVAAQFGHGDVGKLTDGYPRPVDDSTLGGRVIMSGKTVQYTPVIDNAEAPSATRGWARNFGFNSVIAAPLTRQDKVVGVIVTAHEDATPFDANQVALIKSFASQAVIAIENARLFNETKEALERQTATAQILSVISSSPTDIRPVLRAVAESAARLCNATDVIIRQVEGNKLHAVEHIGSIPLPSDTIEAPISRNTIAGRAVLEGKTIHIEDLHIPEVRQEYPEAMFLRHSQVVYRTLLDVPMMREGRAIGVIVVRRAELQPFSEQQIKLLETFAAQAVIAIENVRLFNETKEALERQTATAEILSSISNAIEDTQPVFRAIVESLRRLFATPYAVVALIENGSCVLKAVSGEEPFVEHVRAAYPWPVSDERMLASRVVRAADVVQLCPIVGNPEAPQTTAELAAEFGYNAILIAPLMRSGAVIGYIVTTRKEALRFDDKQVALIKSFADQAVIAIENVRLFNETKEALERQTATSEVLGVISSSPSDVQPVYRTILSNATRLCQANIAALFLYDGESLQCMAHHNATREFAEWLEKNRLRPSRESATRLCALERRTVHIEDYQNDPAFAPSAAHRREGTRTVLSVPLLRAGSLVGVVTVWRRERRLFSEPQIDMVRTFADQAVIAIENARLFNETKEALERQTATAEILGVISRSQTDVQPVFDTIASSALRLCDGAFSVVTRFDGKDIHFAAFSNVLPDFEDALRGAWPQQPGPTSATSRAIEASAMVQIPDILQDPLFGMRGVAEKAHFRSVLAVPMLRDGLPIGAISVSRPQPGAFPGDQVALLKTFADQAVIAIENVRLFNETKESLEQQTAISEVLRVISSNPGDVKPTLKAVARRATRLCDASAATIYVLEGEQLRRRAFHGPEELLGSERLAYSSETLTGRTIAEGKPIHVPDIEEERAKYPRSWELAQRYGRHSMLSVPLMREGKPFGAMFLRRSEVRPFNDKQIALAMTFADQAAIAIENVRLFREIQEKSRQLEEASKHKSQFLASMSHELRTPLNAILGFNEMILGEIYGEVPGDMLEPLKDMQTSGKHLLRLINNVLDLAKIEAGRMELALADYSVQDTVAGVQSTLRPLAADKGLEFVAHVSDDIPLAHGDPGRITQCLMNLAGNSLKFTKAGKVAIAVTQGDGLLRYSVSDTGIGIPADKIASLFTEFKQTDANIASEYGGTGLGLSITKKFIEMHGGRIWVESELGKGSSFVFEIPVRVRA